MQAIQPLPDKLLSKVKSFKPPEKDPDFILADGSKYFGDVAEPEKHPHGYGVAILTDGGKYGGEWRDGYQHGRGVVITNNFEYEGEWDRDHMHGTGIIHYKDGGLVGSMLSRGISLLTLSSSDKANKPLEYRGQLHRDHGRHGKGTMKYRSGDIYEGDWSQNRRHGQGVMNVYQSGDRYTGSWANDERNGHGKIDYPNGARFAGCMSGDKRCGAGRLVFSNGDEYQGQFEEDEVAGRGVMKYRNGDMYDGEWAQGMRHGQGTFRLQKRGAVITGTFVKGLIHGSGSVEFPEKSFFKGVFDKGERLTGTIWTTAGATYHGEWRGDQQHGKGQMWYPSGDHYYGLFDTGVRSGPGNLNYADGNEYSGEFQDDFRHGRGLYQMRNGSIQSGVWEKDAFAYGYTGEWDGEHLCGRGTVTNARGDKWEGLWMESSRHRISMHTIQGAGAGGEVAVFKGAVANDQCTGAGSIRYPQGELYVGHFADNRRSGTGTAMTADGRIFFGEWDDDTLNGPVTYLDVDYNKPITKPIVAAPQPTTGPEPAGRSPTTTPQPQGQQAPAAGQKKSWASRWLKDGKNKGEAVPVPAAGPAVTVVGYQPLCTGQGTWDRGLQSGKSYLFFCDGRVFQGTFQAGKLRIEVAHRTMPNTSPTQCISCKLDFGLFRKPVMCTVCARPHCSSCLKEMTVLPHMQLALLVKVPVVKACKDCFQDVQLGVVQGTMWDGESVFTGYIAGDKPHISGMLWRGQQSCYNGEFSLGKRQGFGVLVHQNGEEYIGRWDNDKEHGLGTYRSNDGTLFEGLWDQGNLRTLHYHGEMNRDLKRDGIGESFHEDGSRYSGQWVEGLRHGTGVYQFPNGVVYTGQFSKGIICGFGREVSQDGGVYVGQFEENQRHGSGMLRTASRLLKGVWQRNKLFGHVVTFHGGSGDVTECLYYDGDERRDAFLKANPVPDTAVTACVSCKANFSMFRRRHHCRMCGNIFCDPCSSRYTTLPIHFGYEEPQRVCQACFVELEEGCSVAVRKYAQTGEVYAGTWVKGVRKGNGLLKRADGTMVVTNDGTAPDDKTSGPDEVSRFQNWWDALMQQMRCDLPYLGSVDPCANPMELQAFDLDVDAFAEGKSQDKFVPAIMPDFDRHPPPPPKPATPAEFTDDEFKGYISNARQEMNSIVNIVRSPAPAINKPSPMPPPKRELYKEQWTLWDVAAVPSYTPIPPTHPLFADGPAITVPPAPQVSSMSLPLLEGPKQLTAVVKRTKIQMSAQAKHNAPLPEAPEPRPSDVAPDCEPTAPAPDEDVATAPPPDNAAPVAARTSRPATPAAPQPPTQWGGREGSFAVEDVPDHIKNDAENYPSAPPPDPDE